MGWARLKPGERFGRLVTVEWLPGSRAAPGVWLCRCDCKAKTWLETYLLTTGVTRSCGCLRKEMTSKRSFLHGRSHTPEHQTWAGIKRRCYDMDCHRWLDYGGRGIGICDRWLNSFVDFFADMGPRPPGMTLERIDNDGWYEPGNCRWATRSEQARNTRKNRYLTYHGRKMLLAEWERETGLRGSRIATRIDVGWTIGQALGFEDPPRRSGVRRKAA